MADLNQLERSDLMRIVGEDEQYAASVIQEKGFNKLYVKATSAPQVLGNLLFEFCKNGTNDNMKVDGSVTPVEFKFENTTANDIIVSALQFEIECGSPSAGGFAGGSSLSNGLLVSIKSEDISFSFSDIQTNYHFDSRFAQGVGSSFLIYSGTGNDYIGAKFSPSSPFILKKTGMYASNDLVKCTVRDNLSGSSVVFLRLIVFGAYDV